MCQPSSTDDPVGLEAVCVYVWWVSVFLLTLHIAYGAHGLESCRSLIPKGQPQRQKLPASLQTEPRHREA